MVEELGMVRGDTTVLCGPLQFERTYGETAVASVLKSSLGLFKRLATGPDCNHCRLDCSCQLQGKHMLGETSAQPVATGCLKSYMM